MSGTLFPARIVVALAIILILIGFATGHLYWHKDRPLCLGGYHWNGPWLTPIAIGKLEIRIHEYYCAPENRYDPKEFHHGP